MSVVQQIENLTERFITIRDISMLTGYSVRAVKLMMQQGTFPEPIRLNSRRNVWRLGVVLHWMDQEEEKARGAVKPIVCKKEVA